jgi:hypothetical protein
LGEFITYGKDGKRLEGEGKEEEALLVDEESMEEKNREFDDLLKNLKDFEKQ